MSAEIKCRRITRKEQKNARTRSHKILSDVQKKLRSKGYRFTWKIVGSGSWGTMIEGPDGMYDLDYQILITEKSKCFREDYKPKRIKDDFFQVFTDCKKKDEKLENSTTAITLINSEETGKHFTVDFVIIRISNDQIIRRNGDNQYTWNELPSKFKETYAEFRKMEPGDKQAIINNVIKKKCEEKRKQDGKSSSEIMLDEIRKHVRK